MNENAELCTEIGEYASFQIHMEHPQKSAIYKAVSLNKFQWISIIQTIFSVHHSNKFEMKDKF